MPVDRQTKVPLLEWGGYPIDPARDAICTYQDVVDSSHDTWGIVGNVDHNLLIIDIDLYKMPDETRERLATSTFADTISDTLVISTPHGGIHIYYELDDSLDMYELTYEHIDLCGDVGGRYAKSHFCDGYTVENDIPPLPITIDQISEMPIFERNDRFETVPHFAFESAPPCIMQAKAKPHDEVDKILLNRYLGRDTPSIYTILDKNDYPPGERVSAPTWMHETRSKTATNFMVDETQDTFRCWRHNVTGNVNHLRGIKNGIISCTDIGDIPKHVWKQIMTDQKLECSHIKAAGKCPVSCGRSHPYDR